MPAARRPQAGLEITSPANPRVKQLAAMRRRRLRDQAAVTLVEGYAELDLALAAGVRPLTVYHCPELAGGDPRGVLARAASRGAERITVSPAVFGKIAYREAPDGWLAVVPAPPAGLAGLRTGSRPLVLICAGVEKPGNLGAILRTADAAGLDAVIAADPATDWGNPNVVRASKGTVFSVPVASAPSAEVLRWVDGAGLSLVATAPGDGVLLSEADLSGPAAVVVGSEASGLAPLWLERADVKVRIPMFGKVDSLNVAASAAIVIYEAVRQRLGRGVMPPPH